MILIVCSNTIIIIITIDYVYHHFRNGNNDNANGTDRKGMLTYTQLPYVAAGTALMTLQPLLVRLSQNSDGRTGYNPITATLLSEAPSQVTENEGFYTLACSTFSQI